MTAEVHPLVPDAFIDRILRFRFGIVGVVLAIAAWAIFAQSARFFDAGRPDLFYLADAFLHGRTWLMQALGPYDVVIRNGHVYVPFAPFPAILFMPLVAVIGPASAHAWEPLINGGLAAFDVWLAWVLAGRLGVRSLVDRFWLVVLLGLSTAIWWVTTRGGVWHTGHLVAIMLTLGALIEAWGRRRPWLLGVLVGAAFLSRAPVLLAGPFFAWATTWGEAPRIEVPSIAGGWTAPSLRSRIDPRTWPWPRLVEFGLGVAPFVLFFFWYNAVRFGSPTDSGYAEATLPAWLEAIREQGLFSTNHLGMNIDYLFTHLPRPIDAFPWWKPDGLGMSIFVTSPGLIYAIRADWRSMRVWALFLTTIAVLVPNLLYYGGGWLQYGYRYALDAIPFLWAICALAAARRGVAWWAILLILFGVAINLAGVYWAYHL